MGKRTCLQHYLFILLNWVGVGETCWRSCEIFVLIAIVSVFIVLDHLATKLQDYFNDVLLFLRESASTRLKIPRQHLKSAFQSHIVKTSWLLFFSIPDVLWDFTFQSDSQCNYKWKWRIYAIRTHTKQAKTIFWRINAEVQEFESELALPGFFISKIHIPRQSSTDFRRRGANNKSYPFALMASEGKCSAQSPSVHSRAE